MRFFLFIFILFTPVMSFARTRPADTDWQIALGVGSVYSPVFEGARETSLSIVPDLRIRYQNKFFASISEGIGYNVIARDGRANGWRAGPITFLKFARDEDSSNPFALFGETDVLSGMGNVGMTFETGGFVDYKYDWFNVRANLRYGIGGHAGWVSDLRLYYATNFGPLQFRIGPNLEIADAQYNQAYFGVDSVQSANTGLSEYSAPAGIVAYGVGGFMLMPITMDIAVSLFWRYSLMGAGARTSPLLQEYGNNRQFTLGLGASYMFRFDG